MNIRGKERDVREVGKIFGEETGGKRGERAEKPD